jgi:4a-hydroxytetrahydrobiopterin dehydratase
MDLTEKKCKPCEGDVDPMNEKQENEYIEQVPSWSLERDGEHKIHKDYKFDDFKEAIGFVNRMADIAEEEGHHPNFTVNYNVVKTDLSTHAIGGLSENDFIMAAKLDQVA